MPMRYELQISAAPLSDRPSAMWAIWSWIVATIKSPEFLMVVLFCAVGLWLTFYFIHYFPNYGEMVESLGQIP
jgi:hypothetical protein